MPNFWPSGGAVPVGEPNGALQWNNDGTLGGSGALVWDDPDEILKVSGDVTIEGSLTAAGVLVLDSDAGETVISEDADQNVVFAQHTAGTTAIQAMNDARDTWVQLEYCASQHIFTGGPVGIGTTQPLFDLDVTGNINCTGSFMVNGNPVTISLAQERVNMLTERVAQLEERIARLEKRK